MFRLFTIKHLTILSLVLCASMLFCALINTATPYISTASEAGIRLPIIMYHHISDDPRFYGDYVIPVEMLREDFEYIKKNNITPISFSELKAFVENGTPLPQKPIILTFDDGHKSFLTKAVPLLEEYGYPANVNIVGSLAELYTENGDNNDRYAYLNYDDIRLINENPLIELGCHTYALHSLSNRRGCARLKTENDADYNALITEDINKFNTLLFEITDCRPVIFAYPYGIRNDFLLELLKEQGFKITLTCREAVNVVSVGSSLLELGRFNRPFKANREAFFKKLYNL